jgi:hypothetical protein
MSDHFSYKNVQVFMLGLPPAVVGRRSHEPVGLIILEGFKKRKSRGRRATDARTLA